MDSPEVPEGRKLGRPAGRSTFASVRPALTVLMAALMGWGPQLFERVFGERWHDAGELARALAPYIALHFIASPLSVAMMAWGAQAWGLKLALVGQGMFVIGLGAGLYFGGLIGAAWGVSATMLIYFGYFFWALAHWKKFPYESAA